MTLKTTLSAYGVTAVTLAFGGFGFGLLQQREACASNMKQIYRALALYASDYDNLIPPAGSFHPTKMKPYGQGGIGWIQQWTAMMSPYVKNRQVFFCPANPYNGTKGKREAGGEDFSDSSYTVLVSFKKQEWFDNNGTPLLHFDRVPNPSVTPYLHDKFWIIENTPGVWTAYTGHGTDYNCLYLDGHVDFLSNKVPPKKESTAGDGGVEE